MTLQQYFCLFVFHPVYCIMQSIPGSSQMQELVISGGSRFYYSIGSFELINVVGAIAAVLKAYYFFTENQEALSPLFTLYKTEEGNWYDMPAEPFGRASLILWQLKSAIDSKEAGG